MNVHPCWCQHPHWCLYIHNVRWVSIQSGWANKANGKVHTTHKGSNHNIVHSKSQVAQDLMSITRFGQHWQSHCHIDPANWSGPKIESTSEAGHDIDRHHWHSKRSLSHRIHFNEVFAKMAHSKNHLQSTWHAVPLQNNSGTKHTQSIVNWLKVFLQTIQWMYQKFPIKPLSY